ncbi:phosphatase 2C (PP2C)-like protein [Corchorus olitorius]|uniref:Phosphatase 2C (PP2C)-like protein n=1 Tax=Corchorus olitorius TaxID=93759 RepID=A0A1R3JSE6_9ROSI|nr:phosphatase 2C (PP2C)-like protein [Corchorus olitorius]
MGACCSTQVKFKGRSHDHRDDYEEKDYDGHEEDHTHVGPDGAIVRLQGSSTYTSMYTRQGKKGTNQDALTVWENFMGEKNTFFCGVFDGHGPSGHRIAHYICDSLPSKVSSEIKLSRENSSKGNECDMEHGRRDDIISSWETSLIEAFREVDVDLSFDESLDSYSSGTTAVTVLKKGEDLLISNLGDSRAVLCTRDDRNLLVPIQLTNDLKPSIPSEAERIKKCGGRVFALEEEPSVPRVWMPNQNCPGLAMARAFGDFCLKDHGLSSIPQVSYRRITNKDEFVVLATDGVWDVLTNNEVIQIVASVKKRSMAAKLLVYYAVQAWKTKYPGSKIDDCAVVCLFFKKRSLLSRSRSLTELNQPKESNMDIAASESPEGGKKTDEGETVINCNITVDQKTLDEIKRVNAYANPSRVGSLSRRKAAKDFEGTEAKR